jgi:hypothetical protein
MLQRKVVGWNGATDLKGVTNALVPFYASLHCHFMIQGTSSSKSPYRKCPGGTQAGMFSGVEALADIRQNRTVRLAREAVKGPCSREISQDIQQKLRPMVRIARACDASSVLGASAARDNAHSRGLPVLVLISSKGLSDHRTRWMRS